MPRSTTTHCTTGPLPDLQPPKPFGYPSLSLPRKTISLAAAFAIVHLGVATAGLGDGGFLILMGQVLLCACLFRFVITWQLQHMKQRHLISIQDAAQAESKFCEVDGVSVHLLEEQASATADLTLVFLHGLGANAFTWEAVMRPLCRRFGINCMAHDRVGFGLTERPQDVSKYANPFNVRVVQELACIKSYERVVLVGHSLGGLTMALAALSMPNVEALVLVAPAILPGTPHRSGMRRRCVRCCTRFAISSLEKCVMICYPLVVDLLRTIVYSSTFWKWGVGKSWFDKTKVPVRLLTQYQWPSLVLDWDVGMLNFLRCHLSWVILALSTRVSWAVEAPTHDGRTLAQRLDASGVPILIMHGSEDLFVPVQNSHRLHQQLQNSEFVEFPHCGHTPHEEIPDKFVQIVGKFVRDRKGTRSATKY